ncbi:MAG TPA: serine hydrolase [Armatimonadota bacterium]|nr:serine hydrolase [Armatimonadota bacterium]
MNRLALLLALPLALLLAPPLQARRAKRSPLSELKREMDRVAEGFGGTLGYSLHFRGRPEERISLRGDERFPSASTIKIAVMCEALRQVDQGKLSWTAEIPIQPPTEYREEGGPAYWLKEDAKLPLPQWLHLMITMSDNTATINLRNRLGQGNINQWLTANGFRDTLILNGKETDALGLRPLQRQYGLGMTTPNEMVRLLERIRDGRAGSPATCDRMLRLLSHQYWDDLVLSQAPPTAHTAAKSGALDAMRADVALVQSPAGEYVLAVYTKDQKDQRWETDNEGNVAIRKLAALVWRRYDPERTWSPPEGAEKLYPGG